MAVFEDWQSEKVYKKYEEPLSPLEEGEEMVREGEKLALSKPDYLWRFLTTVTPMGMVTRLATRPKEVVERELIDPIPVPGWRQFATEERTEAFMSLSAEDKIKALAWDTVESAAYLFGGLVVGATGRGLGFGAKTAARAVGKRVGTTPAGEKLAAWGRRKFAPVPGRGPKVGPEILPTSRIQSMRGFDYEEALAGKKGVLKRRYKVGDDEAAALSEAIQDPATSAESLGTVIAGRLAGKKKPSEGFDKLVHYQETLKDGVKGVTPTFREGVLDKLTPTQLQREFYLKKIRKELKGLKYRGEPVAIDVVKAYPEAAFKKQAIKFLGREEGTKLRLGDATPEQMVRYIEDMVVHPDAVLKLQSPHGQKWVTSFTPMEDVFGHGQPYFQTYTKVWKPGRKTFLNYKEQMAYETLTFNNMLGEAGLLKKPVTLDKFGVPIVKATGEYTPKVQEKAAIILQKIDEASQAARKGLDFEGMADLERQLVKTYEIVSEGDPLVGKFIKTARRFWDHLYGDMVTQKIPILFERSGLKMTSRGRREITRLVDEKIVPVVDKVFVRSHIPTVGSPISAAVKKKQMERILEGTRKKLDEMVARGDMFDLTGKRLEEGVAKLKKNLSIIPSKRTNPLGWADYLENYAPRQGVRADKTYKRWTETLLPGQPAYELPRSKVLAKRLTFPEMFNARLSAQMKDLYLHDGLNDIVQHSRNLPLVWRQNIEHWISNNLGRPSAHDVWWAGKMRQIPGMKAKTVEEVMQSSRALTAAQYAAGIGLNIFATIRNLFQGLVTVPFELGGPGGVPHLAAGLGRMIAPGQRKLLREIGVMGEYAEEMAKTSGAVPWKQATKRTIGGKKIGTVPKAEFYTLGLSDVQDATYYLYKAAEHFNRYSGGGAALNKWELALKFLEKPDNFKKFIRRSGVKGTDFYIKDDIIDLLNTAKAKGFHSFEGRELLNKARDVKILDSVGSSHFWYGKIHGPRAVSRFGAVGRNITLYQSWWMQYGNLFAKWLRTGDVGTKLGRAFSGMVGAGLAAEGMGLMWEKKKAVKGVFLGPFMDILGGSFTPQIIQPFAILGRFAIDISRLMVTGIEDLTPAEKRRVNALIKAPVKSIGVGAIGALGTVAGQIAKTVVPGGGQFYKIKRALEKKGLPGVQKEVFPFLSPEPRHRKGWRPITLPGKVTQRLALGFLRGGR